MLLMLLMILMILMMLMMLMLIDWCVVLLCWLLLISMVVALEQFGFHLLLKENK